MESIRPNSLVIIKNGDKVLAQKGVDSVTGNIFYRLLGGGIEFGETSLVSIKREIREELGVDIQNEKLLDVIENIFEYNGKPGHEITFLYEAELADLNDLRKEKFQILDKENRYAEWISMADCKDGKIDLYPIGVSRFL